VIFLKRKEKFKKGQAWWLKPIILITKEVQVRRILV
jgi:hypothetical protein